MDLDLFLLGYITAALWSTNDESTPAGGEPFDTNYSRDDLAPETEKAMREDCEEFIADNAADLALYAERYTLAPNYTVDECAGHDFWLTRAHHGVGFGDRGLGDLGDRLTTAAQGFGEFDLYLGDDGQIHA